MSNNTKLRMKDSNSFQINMRRFPIYLFLVLLTLMCIVPLWLLVVNATRSTVEIQSGISLIPSTNLVANFNKLSGRNFSLPRGFANSTFLSVSVTVLSVYFSVLTAYAIEVYDFALKDFLQRFIYVLVLIPQQVSIIGFYQYMASLHLTNSYIPLILPAIAAPASVFFAKQYLETCVVRDLIYAGRIDGCGEFGIFHKIMMPMAAPGLFTLAIFAFVASWNNFLTPFIMLNKVELYTLPMLVQLLRGDTYRTEYGAIYFGMLVSILPVVIVYSILAKKIVGGLALGAVKE